MNVPWVIQDAAVTLGLIAVFGVGIAVMSALDKHDKKDSDPDVDRRAKRIARDLQGLQEDGYRIELVGQEIQAFQEQPSGRVAFVYFLSGKGAWVARKS